MRINANKFNSRLPTPISEARFNGSNERIAGADGHINAGSNKEFAARMIEVLNSVANGEIASAAEVASVEDKMASLKDAFNNPDISDWAEIGSDLSASIMERGEREGFMRSILAKGVIANGVPRIRVHNKNVQAVVVRGPAQSYPQIIRNSYHNPEEFSVAARPRVTKREMDQGSPTILDDIYYEGLESIYVKEDRILIGAARRAIGIYNDGISYTGSLTPAIFNTTRRSVSDWTIPVGTVLMAGDLVDDFASSDFISLMQFTPHQAEYVASGKLGNLLGSELMTDKTRHPNLKVLNAGEMFVFGSPEMTGAYTDRGPVQSRPTDEFDNNMITRGWDMWEDISITLANAKAVGYAKKS